MSDKHDTLGDRMKEIEQVEAGRKLDLTLPICIRLDGKGFSKFTKGLRRPFDERLSRLMIEVTKYLVKVCGACLGYTQSDEISLVLYTKNLGSEPFLGGKVQKLTSILASMATAKFNSLLADSIPEKASQLAFFDCRVWNTPTLEEGMNTFQWRELDASKNSVSMLAHDHFSHNKLQSKTCDQMKEMLSEHNISWTDQPDFFKRGTFVQKRLTTRKFTTEEIDSLPPNHQARTNPELIVERSDIRELNLPTFSTIANRVDVVFFGADPILKS